MEHSEQSGGEKRLPSEDQLLVRGGKEEGFGEGWEKKASGEFIWMCRHPFGRAVSRVSKGLAEPQPFAG